MALRGRASTPAASHLDDAIWRTIAYAALFEYPLSLDELCRRLMDVPAAESQIAARLRTPRLRALVSRASGFLLPQGREAWIELRQARAAHTARLLQRHAHALAMLARFPFVRMVALSGACAHGNATDGDVDVFLVTRARRVWTVTLLVMIASKLAGLRRSLCVNYVLGEDGLALPERDRFTASEMVGLKPLAGRDVYRRFVRANAWVAARHPNFYARHTRNSEAVRGEAGTPALERLLEAMGADLFERLARRVMEPYLRRRLHGPGVDLSAQRLKLHARDHRGPVERAFEGSMARHDARTEAGTEARTA